jgi:glycosyltransferase involved in cell wall biosynthesis
VQTWLYHSDLVGGVIAKLCGVRKVLWGVRCEGIGLKRTTQRIKTFCALLSRIVPDLILTNSRAAANRHVKAGYSSKKIKVVHNGFDTSQFAPRKISSAKIGDKIVPTDSLIIGTLARFHKDKDYFTLIKAIDSICEVHNNVRFVLCGQGCSDGNEELNTMLRSLVYQDQVILIDGVSDPSVYLNNLNIFLLTSRTEAFPNSLAEAMLCGLPCISTDVGEVRDILGDAGLIIPHGDPEKLILACLSMINLSESERKHLGFLARARIENRYSMLNYIRNMASIYEH